MACYMPFSSRNLDISFLVFRPTIVLVDELVDELKHFSLCTESLGCIHNALFKSIHGNMIIWYGAWMKRSNENKEILSAALISMLSNVSSMAILIDHSLFDAYVGESKDGSAAAKISTGEIISIDTTSIIVKEINENDCFYVCCASFKSRFVNMKGATCGVSLKGQNGPRIVSLFVWKSLHSCYSWILNSDYRKPILPYLDQVSLDVKYDLFRVVYASGDNVLKYQLFPPHLMLENGVESEGDKVI